MAFPSSRISRRSWVAPARWSPSSDTTAAGISHQALVHRAEKLRDLLRARRPRVRLRAGAGGGRLGDLVQLVLGHAEVAEPAEPAEAGELLDAADRVVVCAERGSELAQRLGSDGLVEAESGGEADRVQRPVRESIAAAERLRHRVPKREHRAAESLPRLARTAEEPCPRPEIAGLGDHP